MQPERAGTCVHDVIKFNYSSVSTHVVFIRNVSAYQLVVGEQYAAAKSKDNGDLKGETFLYRESL